MRAVLRGGVTMERVPVLLEERQVGTLLRREEGLYVRYRAECRLEKPEVLRLFAQGEKGELRLGTPEPRSGVFFLERRISAREDAVTGRLLRGELRRQVRDCGEALTRRWNGGRQVALPFDCRRPFPLPELFCFACVRTSRGRRYAVFTFDREERPLFPGEP